MFDLHEGADGQTYVRTVDDVMAIKPNFLASMGYQYFLSYGAQSPKYHNFILWLSNTSNKKVEIVIMIINKLLFIGNFLLHLEMLGKKHFTYLSALTCLIPQNKTYI